MSGAPKVTIAGAGALGLSTALALADAGCAVTVCDPGGPNASSVAAGMLAPVFEAVLDPQARPHLELLMAARDLWPGFAERAGIALDRSGAIAVGDDAWLEEVEAGFAAVDMRPIKVGRSTIEGLAPRLGPTFQRGLLTREDWRIDPRPALAALRSACTGSGVVLTQGRTSERGGQETLVLAVGYDRSLESIAPELSALSPIKGQLLRFIDVEGTGATLRSREGYAVPSPWSGLAVGATMEIGRDDLETDIAVIAEHYELAHDLASHPDSCASQVEIGIRAATPDGLPMVGPSATPGVILAVGARRNGWLLAPLVARMVTAYVTGRDAGRYAAQFDPGRFGA